MKNHFQTRKKCNKVVKVLLTKETKSHIIPVHPSKTGSKWGIPHYQPDLKQLVDIWDPFGSQERKEEYVCLHCIRSSNRYFSL